MRSVLLHALLGLALLSSCGSGEEARSRRPPILIYAVDGFEWDVILPLVREGRMPVVAGLMERGTFGTLKSLVPTKSPRLWTTLATGKAPSVHGILGFTHEAEDGRTLLYTAADRRTKAFWNILTERGISNDTIGWWVTYPVEPVEGVMVSQTNTEAGKIKKGRLVPGLEGQVWPHELQADVFADFERSKEGLDGYLAEIFGVTNAERPAWTLEAWRQCKWSLRADRSYLSILRSRLERGPPAAVTSVFLGGADVLGHRFWPAYEPDGFPLPIHPDEAAAYGDAIPRYYEFVDSTLGELLARFPSDTTVLIVSDHGMRLGDHPKGEPGAFLAAGPGIRRSGVDPAAVEREDIAELGRLADFCPTLLALVGVPYGDDMLGVPMESLLDPTRVPPLQSIPTHDDPAWLAAREAGVEVEDAQRVEQLRQLGYLGDELDEDD